jgi:hypothetical protein
VVTQKHTRNPTANPTMAPPMTPPTAHRRLLLLNSDWRLIVTIWHLHATIIQLVVLHYMNSPKPLVKAIWEVRLAWRASPLTAPEIFTLSCDEGAGGLGRGRPDLVEHRARFGPNVPPLPSPPPFYGGEVVLAASIS